MSTWPQTDVRRMTKMSLNYELCNRVVGHSGLQAFGLCDKFQPLKISQPNKDPGPGPTSPYFSCHITRRWLLLFALSQGSWTADFWRETMPALGTVSKCAIFAVWTSERMSPSLQRTSIPTSLVSSTPGQDKLGDDPISL